MLEGLRRLPVDAAVLDGEIVAVDDSGKPSFQDLQGEHGPQKTTIQYYAFDLLNYDGADLERVSLTERKQLLEPLVRAAGDPIHFSGALQVRNPEELLQMTQSLGLEVVAKKGESSYESGARTGSWVKYRTGREQEFVVGGYRPGRSSGDFDALIVGYFDGQKLVYAGKVKNGFTPQSKHAIMAASLKLRTSQTPFADLPIGRGGRWGEGLTEEDVKRIVWLRPRLVVQVEFVEWTHRQMLRHPRFKGLRNDKPAEEVFKEVPI